MEAPGYCLHKRRNGVSYTLALKPLKFPVIVQLDSPLCCEFLSVRQSLGSALFFPVVARFLVLVGRQ